MVRNIPTGDNPWNIDPVLSLSLLVASIAATIAVVSSLCGSLTRKKAPPDQPDGDQTKANENKPEVVISPTNEPNASTTPGMSDKPDSPSELPLNEDGTPQLLPPPPGMAHLRAASYHVRSTSSVSHGKSSHGKRLASSMSMKVPGGGLLGSRQMSKREDHHNNDKKKDKDKKLKHEDSIWKKTIILGEKCKVPEDEEDAIVYDEKGKQIPTYHKKTINSLTLSRQSSNIDQEAVPTPS